MTWFGKMFKTKGKTKKNKIKNRDPNGQDDSLQLSAPPKKITSKASMKHLGKMFKELECPICYNVCVPPIETCKNGHMICPACRLLSHVCPTCRERYSGTRNFFAENFINQYAKPCKFKGEGCEYIRWKGENMAGHETSCRYRNIECSIPSCCKSIPYQSLLEHLISCHRVEGCDRLPTVISYDILDPIITSRKWLPYYIKYYGHVFYLMMEVVRPSFYIWVWIQEIKKDALHREYVFTASLRIQGGENSLSYHWEGPVHSVRTSAASIKKDGLCFILPECAMQHFEKDNRISLTLNVEKRLIPKEVVDSVNGNLKSCLHQEGIVSLETPVVPNAPSRQSMYPDIRTSIEDVLVIKDRLEPTHVKSLYCCSN